MDLDLTKVLKPSLKPCNRVDTLLDTTATDTSFCALTAALTITSLTIITCFIKELRR